MKNWNILNKLKDNDIINLLLKNRGFKTKKEKDTFLNPRLEDITVKNVGINTKQLKLAINRIKLAVKNKEQIVVFGDYDVDGITGSAIIWETLHALGAKILPYIPHRIDEGYGLSKLGITNLKSQIPDTKLIITVDNGIVAIDAVAFANQQGIDVIITDHHVAGKTLPDAHSIVHTTSLCGAGVAYVLSKEIRYEMLKVRDRDEDDIHLELAALGTIADLVPLTKTNRAIVKNGLLQLGKRKRLGLNELFKLANLVKNIFTVYEVGYIIAPRLNAAGRIESAMDSLRLLCTKDNARAKKLAQKLEEINAERQNILKKTVEHAKDQVMTQELNNNKIIIVTDKNYQQGVIGLVAGKLVEEFYKPAIVISVGEEFSKGSVRSVSGFNVIEFLRSHGGYFPEVGGHPMAAGFSVRTEKIAELKKALEKSAEKQIAEKDLIRSLKIDCELDLPIVNKMLFDEIQTLAPFGMGNPEPTFVSTDVVVKSFKLLGKDRTHLKLQVQQNESELFDAIGFGLSSFAEKLKPDDKIDIAYTIDENVWNGNAKLQLKIKDIKYGK